MNPVLDILVFLIRTALIVAAALALDWGYRRHIDRRVKEAVEAEIRRRVYAFDARDES